jgi:AhpD family alkylhydroperoxidase
VRGFGALHRHAVGNEGILSSRIRELIAVGIAVTSGCEGCITLHVKAALQAGASPQEIMEGIGVAILMGGGPAMVHSLEAKRPLRDMTGEPLPHPD